MQQNEKPDWRWAEASFNGAMYGIITKSGFVSGYEDDQGLMLFLPYDIDSTNLGDALLQCLLKSRWIENYKQDSFFDKSEIKRRSEIWKTAQAENMDKNANLKNLLKNLMKVAITVNEGEICFNSLYHIEKYEWRYLDNWRDHMIKIPYLSSPDIVGDALRRAFDQCEGEGRDEIFVKS
jgi:hypothetical protein